MFIIVNSDVDILIASFNAFTFNNLFTYCVTINYWRINILEGSTCWCPISPYNTVTLICSNAGKCYFLNVIRCGCLATASIYVVDSFSYSVHVQSLNRCGFGWAILTYMQAVIYSHINALAVMCYSFTSYHCFIKSIVFNYR